MTSYADLVQRVKHNLHSFTGFHEQVTWTTGAIAADALTIPVNDTTQVRVGVAQVDDELIYVSSTDDTNLALAPFGRGYFGSAASSHDANAMVVANPMFPNVAVRNAINECVEGVYPQLFEVVKTTVVFSPSVETYELPADADDVLAVDWNVNDSSNSWQPMLEWDFIENSAETSGKAIALREFALPGATVQVTYSRKPVGFANDGVSMTDAGFTEGCVDVFVFGAMARIVRSMDVARLQVRAVENYARAGFVGVGDANKVANNYYAYYQQRLQEERARLLHSYPPRPHFER